MCCMLRFSFLNNDDKMSVNKPLTRFHNSPVACDLFILFTWIKIRDSEKLKEEEQQLREKYNPDDIFKNSVYFSIILDS